MSLFKARDWWNTKVGGDEDFDIGCMCIGNFNTNDGDQNTEYMNIGSYAGIIRIYHPQNKEQGYQPEHLLLEQSLGAPILQLECGKFASVMTKSALAVLHPRKLAVYTLTSTAGAVEHGAQYKLQMVYQHNLQRTSFNMCYGPFGQILDRDFLCVQSMDGTLSVYEQESFSFTRFLPDSLLPGPLAYVSSTDSFVTVSSARQIESYKYQVLAVASETKTKEDAQNQKSGKRVAPDWSLCIGEQAISVEVIGEKEVFILVLGERNLYCVSEYGKLKFMKKLEYIPRCMRLYGHDNGALQYMITTTSNTLMIYKDTILKWAAQLSFTPVQVDICSLGGSPGGIATLDDHGHLNILYLGTDPAMMVMPSAQYRETKYDEFAAEIKRYQQIIREKSGKQLSKIMGKNCTNEEDEAILPTKTLDDEIKIVVHVPQSLDTPSRSDGVEFNDEDPVPSLTVKIDVKAKMMTSNVKLRLHVNMPLAATQTEWEFPTVSSSNPTTVTAALFMKYNFLPADLKIDVSASYQSSTGAPRVTQTNFLVPLQLVLKPAMPVKSAMYKVTIETNKPPVNLNDIFTDLLGMNAGGPGSALGFQFYGGPLVTMLASKTSQRYRLQSDDFASMWLLTKELRDRLMGHFGKSSGLQCTYVGSLPLQEYFESVDAHFEYRLHAMKYKELLEQRSAQFRAIQRRLLTRFKDKTPSPLAYLDTLLEGTFRQDDPVTCHFHVPSCHWMIKSQEKSNNGMTEFYHSKRFLLIALTEHAEDNRKTLYRASTNLSSATRLLNYLIKLSCDMSEEDYIVLTSVLSPMVTENGEQGWEEIVDTALTHQLRTTLSKSAKDQSVNSEMLSIGTETSKLKKHIAIFIERLAKGAKLSSSDPDENRENKAKKASSKLLDSRNIAEASRENSVLGASDTPIGTKLGEKSPRRAKTNKSLPPLHSSSHDDGEIDATSLPPLNLGKLKPLRKIKPEVPDLDELTNGTTNGHEY